MTISFQNHPRPRHHWAEKLCAQGLGSQWSRGYRLPDFLDLLAAYAEKIKKFLWDERRDPEKDDLTPCLHPGDVPESPSLKVLIHLCDS